MIRWLASWTSAILLGLIVVGPLAALVAAAALDRGPDGAIRASIFPAALALYNPFVGTCVRNGVLMAGSVAVASLLVGIGFGRLLGDWRFPLRRLVLAALTVAAATPPAVLGLGWAVLVDGWGDQAWRGWFDRVGGVDRLAPLDWGWFGWFLAAVAWGGSLTALAHLSAAEHLDPAWRDAARLAGSSRNRVWWRLNWPLLRPAMGRAIGLVFAATLADPGAPLVLGLRRTLGFQIATAALGPEPFPRIAVLALIVLFIHSVAHLALRLWSGADRLNHDPRPRPTPSASFRRTLAAGLFAVFWSSLVIAPVAALVAAAAKGSSVGSWRPSEFGRRLTDPVVVDVIARSAILGVCALVLSLVFRRAVRALQVAAKGASADRFEAFARLGSASPMVGGVVLLSVPGLVAMFADAIGGRSPLLNDLARWMGGERASFVLLTLAVGLALSPRWFAFGRGRETERSAETDRIDAALLAGAGRGRARRLASGASRPARWFAAAPLAILGATNIAPAVLFVLSDQDSTVGPAFLFLREQPGDGLATASALAAVVFALSAAAALASRWRR